MADRIEDLFTPLAQRDDAKTKAEKAYWQGYADCMGDELGLRDGEAEAAYQLMQVESAASLRAVSERARRRGGLTS